MNGHRPKKTRKRIHDRIQRLTFHDRNASLAVSQLRYLFSKSDCERERITLKTISVFIDVDPAPDWTNEKELVKDILYARAYYAINGKEYFLFGLDHAKDAEKEDYVGWHELKHYYDLLNETGAPEIFENKEETYRVFRTFFKRELISVASEQQSGLFRDFFARHKTGIIKPTGSYGGQGVEIVTADNEQDIERLWERMRERCPLVVEELIEQAPEMNAFYPNAVNTIRYNTFFHNGRLTRMQAVFRIGRGGSNVDNATSGGIYALVDTGSGRILGSARSFRGELFERHPDTGAQFEGNEIPRWKELNELLEKVARVVPEQKQVGWDFALSTDGWVMVEGNTTPALQSFDLDHGLRSLIHQTFGQAIPLWG